MRETTHLITACLILLAIPSNMAGSKNLKGYIVESEVPDRIYARTIIKIPKRVAEQSKQACLDDCATDKELCKNLGGFTNQLSAMQTYYKLSLIHI